MKSKYVVMTHFDSFYSNSRNARKHLIETGEDYVMVYTNTEKPTLLCMAKRELPDLILVGTCK